MLYLNTIAPNTPRKAKKRVGRGTGSGLGKTCGRGHKGQHARAGGYHKVGFEGGQMPLQRRLPKFGFTSRKKASFEDLPASVLDKIFDTTVITLEVLREHGFIRGLTTRVKLYSQGEQLTRALTLKGVQVTRSVKEKIEKAGGSVE